MANESDLHDLVITALQAANKPISALEVVEMLYEESCFRLEETRSWRMLSRSLFVRLPIFFGSGHIYQALYDLEEDHTVYGIWEKEECPRPWDKRRHRRRLYALFPQYKIPQ